MDPESNSPTWLVKQRMPWSLSKSFVSSSLVFKCGRENIGIVTFTLHRQDTHSPPQSRTALGSVPRPRHAHRCAGTHSPVPTQDADARAQSLSDSSAGRQT